MISVLLTFIGLMTVIGMFSSIVINIPFIFHYLIGVFVILYFIYLIVDACIKEFIAS